MEVLEKNGSLGKLEGWSAKNALKAKCLLMEFHHMFCLEEGEIGVTDTAEHIIKLLPGQDKPFKERFLPDSPTRCGGSTMTRTGDAGWRGD